MKRSLAFALALLAALAAAAAAGASAVGSYRAAQHRATEAQRTVAALRIQLDNAQGATEYVTQYVDRVREIRIKGDTIIKEVPRYVSAQADAACVVPVGFVRLHDAAAAGVLSDPGTGDADAAPAGLALSTVGATIADNYTTSHANAEQLTQLQTLLRAQGVNVIGDDNP